MKLCRVKGCQQEISMLTVEGGDDRLCHYHWKVKAGLIEVDDAAIRRELGISRGSRTKAIPVLRGIGADAVLSDEELDLLDLLEVVGKATGMKIVRRSA